MKVQHKIKAGGHLKISCEVKICNKHQITGKGVNASITLPTPKKKKSVIDIYSFSVYQQTERDVSITIKRMANIKQSSLDCIQLGVAI